MIIDSRLEFSDAQALTASAASTNYIDLTVSRNVGVGYPLYLVCTVDVAADYTSANETYAIAIESDDNSSFSSATAQVSRTIAASALTAGSKHVIPVPNTNERYMRVYYTLGGTTPSVTISAFLTEHEPEVWTSIADSI